MWIYRPIDERKDIFARSIEFAYINKVTSTLDGVVLFEEMWNQHSNSLIGFYLLPYSHWNTDYPFLSSNVRGLD